MQCLFFLKRKYDILFTTIEAPVVEEVAPAKAKKGASKRKTAPIPKNEDIEPDEAETEEVAEEVTSSPPKKGKKGGAKAKSNGVEKGKILNLYVFNYSLLLIKSSQRSGYLIENNFSLKQQFERSQTFFLL